MELALNTPAQLDAGPPQVNHVRFAVVNRWVDGDTVWLAVDQDFRDTKTTDFRLYGIDTPERGKYHAAEASAHAKELAPHGSIVTVRTFKDPDKYGRWLAEIFTTSSTSVNQAMVDAGLATPYFGGKKSPPAVAP